MGVTLEDLDDDTKMDESMLDNWELEVEVDEDVDEVDEKVLVQVPVLFTVMLEQLPRLTTFQPVKKTSEKVWKIYISYKNYFLLKTYAIASQDFHRNHINGLVYLRYFCILLHSANTHLKRLSGSWPAPWGICSWTDDTCVWNSNDRRHWSWPSSSW